MQNETQNISAILITHEHQDHLHIDSLKTVLQNNPNAVVITNTAVGKFLAEANIPYTKIEEGQKYNLEGIDITGFGNTHAEIYEQYGQVQNTGYMISTLCYPGDSFNLPDSKVVEILALPVAGPWMRAKDAINYAKILKPRVAFPVHDAFIHDWASFLYKLPETILKNEHITFKKLELGKEEDL